MLWLSPLAPYLIGTYFVGVVLMLFRLATGLWGGHRLRRSATLVKDVHLLKMIKRLAVRIGLQAVPTVAYSRQISIPIVVGVFKPMILLPTSLASGLMPDQLQALVTHELAHIRRYDLLVNLLQRLIEAVLFFHPAIWFISRRIAIERKNAADDLVVESGWRRVQYADALVRMAELSSLLRNTPFSNQAAVLAASGTNASDFKRRVLRLLENANTPRLRLTHDGVLAMVLLVTSLLAMPGVVQNWGYASPDDPTWPTAAEEGVVVESDTVNVRLKLRDNDGQQITPAVVVRVQSGRRGYQQPL